MRGYRILVRVSQFSTDRQIDAVREAINAAVYWIGNPDEDLSEVRTPGLEPHMRFEIEGRTQLGGGRSTQEASEGLRDDVWRACSEYVPVEVHWWDDEREPDESEEYSEEDYAEWLDSQESESGQPEDDKHVVVDASVQPPAFRCLHCKQIEGVGLPLSVDTFAQRANAFGKKHKGCKKPEEQ